MAHNDRVVASLILSWKLRIIGESRYDWSHEDNAVVIRENSRHKSRTVAIKSRVFHLGDVIFVNQERGRSSLAKYHDPLRTSFSVPYVEYPKTTSSMCCPFSSVYFPHDAETAPDGMPTAVTVMWSSVAMVG